MFYILDNDKIVLYNEDKQKLENTLNFMPQYAGLDILETDRNIVQFNNGFYFEDEIQDEINQAEKDRIQELYMTRSDFFDGTIQAWGVGQDELLILIQNLLITLPIEDVKKLMAINNFKNALNFYRKHDLFKLLVNIPIQLTENIQIIITEEHLDNFFNEIDKGNKETAWQYLPQPVSMPIKNENKDEIEDNIE